MVDPRFHITRVHRTSARLVLYNTVNEFGANPVLPGFNVGVREDFVPEQGGQKT